MNRDPIIYYLQNGNNPPDKEYSNLPKKKPSKQKHEPVLMKQLLLKKKTHKDKGKKKNSIHHVQKIPTLGYPSKHITQKYCCRFQRHNNTNYSGVERNKVGKTEIKYL